MAKPVSIQTLKKKTFETFDFYGDYRVVFGNPERFGFWIIYGKEKHGKTWLSLLLADYFSKFEKCLFISAEEGLSKNFVEAIERAQLRSDNKRLGFVEYVELDYVRERLSKRKAPKVIFFDNITAYEDELKGGKLTQLFHDYKNKALFVFLAHEDEQKKGQPYTAAAKKVKKFASVIIRVEGLTGFVSGRCPGGALMVDEAKAQLYHGTEVLENQ